MLNITDGQVTSERMLSQVVPTIKAIHQKRRVIKLARQATYEKSLLFDFLAYSYTRDLHEIKPIMDRESSLGYWYPFLSGALMQSSKEHSIFSILEAGTEDGYLSSGFLQATYVCGQCNDGFLTYREVCPSCHSSHLRTEDIIHHFRCAHVAPLSDFRAQKDGEIFLECPKCHHELKHIGVDYDKPSSMHYCLSCHTDFQNYLMKAKCLSCHHDQEVEYLIKKEIRSFCMTEKAISALHSGRLYNEENFLNPEIEGALSWMLFQRTLAYEQENRSGSNNFIVELQFQDLKTVVRQIGVHNKTKLFTEVIQIAQASQQATDFRGVKNNVIYYTLLKTSKSEAEAIAQRTLFLINHLMMDNLKIKRNIITSEIRLLSELVFENVVVDG